MSSAWLGARALFPFAGVLGGDRVLVHVGVIYGAVIAVGALGLGLTSMAGRPAKIDEAPALRDLWRAGRIRGAIIGSLVPVAALPLVLPTLREGVQALIQGSPSPLAFVAAMVPVVVAGSLACGSAIGSRLGAAIHEKRTRGGAASSFALTGALMRIEILESRAKRLAEALRTGDRRDVVAALDRVAPLLARAAGGMAELDGFAGNRSGPRVGLSAPASPARQAAELVDRLGVVRGMVRDAVPRVFESALAHTADAQPDRFADLLAGFIERGFTVVECDRLITALGSQKGARDLVYASGRGAREPRASTHVAHPPTRPDVSLFNPSELQALARRPVLPTARPRRDGDRTPRRRQPDPRRPRAL